MSWRDTVSAVRMMHQKPAFAAITILTLALAIPREHGDLHRDSGCAAEASSLT